MFVPNSFLSFRTPFQPPFVDVLDGIRVLEHLILKITKIHISILTKMDQYLRSRDMRLRRFGLFNMVSLRRS